MTGQHMQVEARANIVTLGAILVTAGISWGVMTAGLGQVQEQVKTQQDNAITTDQRNRETLAAHEARIRGLENNGARQDERLLLILDSVRKIEAKLERGNEQ